jgi:phage nucleotide-binding protein
MTNALKSKEVIEMAVQVIKAREIKTRPVRVLIYGEPGAGKTTLLATALRPLLVIDFEGGSDIRLAGQDQIDIVLVHSRKELEEVLKWLKTQNTYKTIAFDGFSIYVQQALREILEERSKPSPTFYEWGLLSSHMRDVILALLKPTANTVFTALIKEEERQENGQTIRYKRPDLPKAIRNQLRAITDIEGVLYAKDGQRFLGFTAPKGGAEVKDRSGRLSHQEEPDLAKVFSKIFIREVSQ